DLELPILHVGFYDSLVVFDQRLGRTWIISTGLTADGTRQPDVMHERLGFWRHHLSRDLSEPKRQRTAALQDAPRNPTGFGVRESSAALAFVEKVKRIQQYIRLGHIYQANLSQ